MKIELRREGKRYQCKREHSDSRAVDVQGDVTCDRRGSALRIYSPEAIKGHNTVEGRAFSQCCDEPVGRLIVIFETLFGLEEDERVLDGRCRVY